MLFWFTKCQVDYNVRMQLKIIKQGISHSFIFQNQHIYCDKKNGRML